MDDFVYFGLPAGTIVRVGNDFCMIYPSRSYLSGILIPFRRLKNREKCFNRIPGGVCGFQTYTCQAPLIIDEKTDYAAMEHLAWESDDIEDVQPQFSPQLSA